MRASSVGLLCWPWEHLPRATAQVLKGGEAIALQVTRKSKTFTTVSLSGPAQAGPIWVLKRTSVAARFAFSRRCLPSMRLTRHPTLMRTLQCVRLRFCRSRSASDGAVMPKIADWLKTLGMSEYAERFAESDIDTSVLPDLTDRDLKELGVSLGHRRKMLRAIAELSGVALTSPQPALMTAPKPQDTAERRQVTVMFCDLVGSTALSARMDPEDLREVISAYQKCVAGSVQHFGGFVAKYMGDGVLIYFGYPQAHEDDAERAVRAGLELVAAVGALKTHAPLQTRVGIATGLVVVGDLIGSGASQEQAIVGETPNLAARLQGIAEPNSVVIAESTRKLVGNLFELEDLGART